MDLDQPDPRAAHRWGLLGQTAQLSPVSRFVIAGILTLCSSVASADVEFALLAGVGSAGSRSAAGPRGAAELVYSPQGFWAVGARAGFDESFELHPQFLLRASLDILSWVPRLDLSLGYADGLSWGVGLGLDRFLSRQFALRSRAAYGQVDGLSLIAGLAWFPFD